MPKDKHITYLAELKDRLKAVKTAIKEQETRVYESSSKFTTEWFKAYKDLNHLNIKKMTIESRIENHDKFPGGLEPYHGIYTTDNQDI